MKTTIVKTQSRIQNPRLIANGYVLFNPTKTPMNVKGDNIHIIARVPRSGDTVQYVKAKSYDGVLTNSFLVEFERLKEETVDGVTVITYNVPLLTLYCEDKDGNNLYYAQILSADYPASRIDIEEGYDVIISGKQESGYNCPFYINAEQLEHSSFSQNCVLPFITNCRGVIKTEWFRGNDNPVYMYFMGIHVNLEGNILDFSSCINLIQANFYLSQKLRGDMRELLNALKTNGARSRTIEIRIAGTSVTNDVTQNYSPVYATFDASGNWTASNTAPNP